MGKTDEDKLKKEGFQAKRERREVLAHPPDLGTGKLKAGSNLFWKKIFQTLARRGKAGRMRKLKEAKKKH